MQQAEVFAILVGCNRTAVRCCSSRCVCHIGCWPRTCPSRPAPVPTRVSFQNLNLIDQISVFNFLHTNSETAIWLQCAWFTSNVLTRAVWCGSRLFWILYSFGFQCRVVDECCEVSEESSTSSFRAADSFSYGCWRGRNERMKPSDAAPVCGVDNTGNTVRDNLLLKIDSAFMGVDGWLLVF